MLEQQGYSLAKELYSSNGLQSAITRAWPESSVNNFDQLTNTDITAVVTFCPLYEQGTLDDSRVLPLQKASIENSRVTNKWNAVQAVMREVNAYVKGCDGSLSLTAVFANKGILFNGLPTRADYEAVETHSTIYQEALKSFSKEQGINMTYYTYDDLDVSFPRFVNPLEEPPQVEEEGVIFVDPHRRMIAELNVLIHGFGIPVTVVENKKNREIVEKLQRIKGISRNGAFWVIAGYLAFDYKLPELVGENGFYIATERFEPHFGITNMTPGLRDMPKVKLKA